MSVFGKNDQFAIFPANEAKTFVETVAKVCIAFA